MDQSDVRDDLVGSLRKKLMGPEEEDESFAELPNRKYIVGVLYPQGTEVLETSEGEGFEGDTDEPEGEEDAAPMPFDTHLVLKQSSMGMSFIIEGDLESSDLRVEVQWRTYTQKEVDDTKTYPDFIMQGPHFKSFPIRRKKGRMEISEFPKMSFEWISESVGDRYTAVTAFLINETESTEEKAELNRRCVFSPKIRILSKRGLIVDRTKHTTERFVDNDTESLKLLYHKRKEFAVGHGCSVRWDFSDTDGCRRIETEFIPTYIQKIIKFEIDGVNLPISDFISDEKKKDALTKLRSMLDRYERWVSETFSDGERDALTEHKNAFDRHHKNAKRALERMREGLNLLLSDGEAWEAFKFMNESMLLQRMHYEASHRYRETGTYDELSIDDRKNILWRPFQMAFILQTIPEIVNPTKSERNVVDLLWIPTGGGKTEAYLGLAAFTMAYRRLRHGPAITEHGGVSVMMRYTLRLLTIQQFQRAATLMCACEHIRRKRITKYGDDSFLVGLYVGRNTTPNNIGSQDDIRRCEHARQTENYTEHVCRSAHKALSEWKIHPNELPDESNPFQILHCPWCGHGLGPDDYMIDDDKRSLKAYCPNKSCEFHNNPIPIVTVDEEIYRRLPSLVIGTVDKFAMLPFQPKIASLFGHVRGYCEKHGFVDISDEDSHNHRSGDRLIETGPLPAPDLIIQDELHLINGPLGSMVGQYEMTMERLSERNENGRTITPKYIASTATIRRSETQIWALYGGKQSYVFPPPGTDISYPFFFTEIEKPEEGKMFVGIMPTGIGHKTIMVRTLSQILSRASKMVEEGVGSDLLDPYWTVVAYFNTIRELGSDKSAMEDDVQNSVSDKRPNLKIQELTSRLQSSELAKILELLNKKLKDGVDILACSNMFSVGIDVQRLGLMVMNGQPKTTSEYIQATGRVGRRSNGLVISLYSWARPRDRSHYEMFYDYHNKIHSHVEAMSVTPFSDGAIERTIHAQYIGLLRSLEQDLISNKDADNFDTVKKRDCRAYVEDIRKRATDICGEDTGNTIYKKLDELSDIWTKYAEDTSGKVVYDADFIANRKSSDNERYHPILMKRKEPPKKRNVQLVDGLSILTPTSMRNVEKEVRINKIWIPRGV